MVDKVSDVKANWALGAMITEINSFSRDRSEVSRNDDSGNRSDSMGVLLSLIIGKPFLPLHHIV